MKITDMSSKSLNRINKLTESRFGYKINYNKMTGAKARKMLANINEAINKVRYSHDIHRAEKNPAYMELLMLREGITSWIKANRRRIMESEVGQAEAILAAKDMVDSLQDMMEKVGKMSIEQLPALHDTIRDQIGSEQAANFKTTVGQVLTSVMDSLSQARDQVDSATRALSGEQVEQMSIGGADQNTDLDMEPSDDTMPDLDLDDSDEDPFAGTDAAAGGRADVGREMR